VHGATIERLPVLFGGADSPRSARKRWVIRGFVSGRASVVDVCSPDANVRRFPGSFSSSRSRLFRGGWSLHSRAPPAIGGAESTNDPAAGRLGRKLLPSSPRAIERGGPLNVVGSSTAAARLRGGLTGFPPREAPLSGCRGLGRPTAVSAGGSPPRGARAASPLRGSCRRGHGFALVPVPPAGERRLSDLPGLKHRQVDPGVPARRTSRSFAAIGSRFRRLLEACERLLPRGGVDLHTAWVRWSTAGHRGRARFSRAFLAAPRMGRGGTITAS